MVTIPLRQYSLELQQTLWKVGQQQLETKWQIHCPYWEKVLTNKPCIETKLSSRKMDVDEGIRGISLHEEIPILLSGRTSISTICQS